MDESTRSEYCLTRDRTLVDEEWTPEYEQFVKDNGITSHIIPIIANKDPQVYTSPNTVMDVLEILLNRENHPVLVHCNKGKVSSPPLEYSSLPSLLLFIRDDKILMNANIASYRMHYGMFSQGSRVVDHRYAL